MADINALFPSKFLKSADIKGKEPTVCISKLEVEAVAEGEHKPVLYFQNASKGMVLNRTNADTIAQSYGPDTDSWLGKEITIYVARVQGPNGMTDGLRVRVPIRPAAAQRVAAQPAGNHIVQQRAGYQLSEIRKPDPIEEVTGAPTRSLPADGDEIPF